MRLWFFKGIDLQPNLSIILRNASMEDCWNFQMRAWLIKCYELSFESKQRQQLTQRRSCASPQTVANKILASGVQETKRRNITKVIKKVWQNLKLTFGHFQFENDICTRGRPFHKLYIDIYLDQIARQNIFLKFMLIYAKIFEPIKFCNF